MNRDLVVGLIETYGTNNPFELCNCLDIQVIYSNLGTEIKGFFQRINAECEIIHINTEIPCEEQTYVCAHELYHALDHEDLSISFFINNPLQVKNKYEIEADMFAAELIIDKIDDYILETMNLEQIASYLRVPRKLVEYKLKRR